MSHSLAVAGLVVDSWRDQSPKTEPSKRDLPDGVTPTSQLRTTSDDVPSTPPLTSLIALGAVRWKSHRGEFL